MDPKRLISGIRCSLVGPADGTRTGHNPGPASQSVYGRLSPVEFMTHFMALKVAERFQDDQP
jgi:hypothetical protein